MDDIEKDEEFEPNESGVQQEGEKEVHIYFYAYFHAYVYFNSTPTSTPSSTLIHVIGNAESV